MVLPMLTSLKILVVYSKTLDRMPYPKKVTKLGARTWNDPVILSLKVKCRYITSNTFPQ